MEPENPFGPFRGIQTDHGDLSESLVTVFENSETVTLTQPIMEQIANRIKRLSHELLARNGTWA